MVVLGLDRWSCWNDLAPKYVCFTPKADISLVIENVRLVPKADFSIHTFGTAPRPIGCHRSRASIPSCTLVRRLAATNVCFGSLADIPDTDPDKKPQETPHWPQQRNTATASLMRGVWDGLDPLWPYPTGPPSEGEAHRRKECHSGVTAAARNQPNLMRPTNARKLSTSRETKVFFREAEGRRALEHCVHIAGVTGSSSSTAHHHFWRKMSS